MAQPPIPGVPLSVLQEGLLGGLDTAITRNDPYAQAKTLYRSLPPEWRKRVDATARRNGTVSASFLQQMYNEWVAQQAATRRHNTVPMGVRGSVQNILRDTTESDLA